MTHNPYANAHPVGGGKWTEDEDAKVKAMLALGMIHQEISDAMPGRSLHSIKSRARYLSIPCSVLAEEYRIARNNRAKPKYQRKTMRNHVLSETIVVPPEVIEERNQRYMAPRDITGFICGDPPRGFSALERGRA